MLENLDSVPWGSLKHAYGFADDVPDLIRDLLDSNPKTRESALWGLYGNIFHQGTRYQATPYAIPFLFELVESEEVHDREKLILHLVSIALGYENYYLPEGINVQNLRAENIEAEENLTHEQRLENKKYGYNPLSVLDCYEEVNDRVPIFQNLAFHKNSLISKSAIYALAWFPEHANPSIKIIEEQLRHLQKEDEIANAILSIGLLARSSDCDFEFYEFEKHLKSDSQLVKTSAAIALAQSPLPNKILDILAESIVTNSNLLNYDNFYFNEGNIAGYVSSILSKYSATNNEKILPILCEILKESSPFEALDILESIFNILNKNRKILIKNSKLEDLNKIEILVLNTILIHEGWESFGNYSLLIAEAGIPHSKKELRNFLKLN